MNGNPATEIEIFVQLDDKKESVDAIASSPIRSIRPQIEKAFNTSIQYFSLSCDGKLLSEDKSFLDYGIGDGSIIELSREKPKSPSEIESAELMQLFVRLPDSETISLKISPNKSVASLKGMISKIKQIPVLMQDLIYSGTTLEDSDLLSSYEIGMESTLSLAIKEEDEEEIDIFVKASFGQDATIKLNLSQTVQQLKAEIYKKLGILPAEQLVFHAGMQLEDEKVLSTYQFQSDTSLFVDVAHNFVHIIPRTSDGKKSGRIKLQPSDTVSTLKKEIESLTKIAHDVQILAYNGSLLQDDKPLSHYNIEDNSVVTVLEAKPFKINVKDLTGDSSKALSVEIYGTYLIKKLKELIKMEKNIDVESQMLMFGGEKLDDTKTVSESKIAEGADIYVARTSETEHFFWKDDQSNVFVMEVESSTRIKEVKAKLQNKLGVPLSLVKAISEISKEVEKKVSRAHSSSVIDEGFVSAYF